MTGGEADSDINSPPFHFFFARQKICQTSLHKLCKYNMYSIGHWEREREREKERERERAVGSIYYKSYTARRPRFEREKREKTYHERASAPVLGGYFEIDSFICNRTCS